MAEAVINTRVDPQVKREADELFSRLGLTTSAAINVFLRQAIRVQGLPFAVTLDTPNEETVRAMREADRGIGLSRRYNSAHEMISDILREDDDV